MRTGVIYKITSPSGKVYIGQTVNLKVRLSIYRRCACPKQAKLFQSLKKYGFDSHKLEILQEAEEEKLAELELHYIKFYDCVNEGLNCSYDPSSVFRGRKHSEETKEKMSRVRKGRTRIISPEHKQALSIAAKRRLAGGALHNRQGVKLSDDTRKKISEARNKTQLSPR